MNLGHLVMFKEVAEHGTLRLAAERLHKTQPAVSQGIRQLESNLSLELFSRTGYRLQLTNAGKIVYQHALRTLDEADKLREVASHFAAGHETSISLAIEASFDLTRILPILEGVQNEFPATQIVLKQEYISGAVESLRSGNADFCISAMDLATELDPSFEFHYIGSGVLLNVASPILLARHPRLELGHELLDEYQIVVQDSGAGTEGKELGVRDGQRRWYVNDFATKKMLIESGMGWGKVPLQFAESSLDSGRLIALELLDTNNRVDLRFFAIRQKGHHIGPVAQTLWAQLKTVTQ